MDPDLVMQNEGSSLCYVSDHDRIRDVRCQAWAVDVHHQTIFLANHLIRTGVNLVKHIKSKLFQLVFNSYPAKLWTLDSGLSGHIIQDLTRLKRLGIAKPLRDIRVYK